MILAFVFWLIASNSIFLDEHSKDAKKLFLLNIFSYLKSINLNSKTVKAEINSFYLLINLLYFLFIVAILEIVNGENDGLMVNGCIFDVRILKMRKFVLSVKRR